MWLGSQASREFCEGAWQPDSRSSGAHSKKSSELVWCGSCVCTPVIVMAAVVVCNLPCMEAAIFPSKKVDIS